MTGFLEESRWRQDAGPPVGGSEDKVCAMAGVVLPGLVQRNFNAYSSASPLKGTEGRPGVSCKPDPVIPVRGRRPFIWDPCCQGPRATYPFRRSVVETRDGPPLKRNLFGLAPGGGCQALPVTWQAGGLLPRLFTLTPSVKRGGLFSVALSLGLPPVAVSDLPALWCPDFPPPASAGSGRPIPRGALPVRPSLTSTVYNTSKNMKNQDPPALRPALGPKRHALTPSARGSTGPQSPQGQASLLPPLAAVHCLVGKAVGLAVL